MAAEPGWKHALNAVQFSPGSVFGWTENGGLWSGIVEDVGACCVKVRDVLPAYFAAPRGGKGGA